MTIEKLYLSWAIICSFFLVSFFFFFLFKCGHVYMTKLLGFVLTVSWFLSSFVIHSYSPFWICRRVAENVNQQRIINRRAYVDLTVVFVMCRLSLCEMGDPLVCLSCSWAAVPLLINAGHLLLWLATVDDGRRRTDKRSSTERATSTGGHPTRPHCVTTTHWRNNKDKRER